MVCITRLTYTIRYCILTTLQREQTGLLPSSKYFSPPTASSLDFDADTILGLLQK